jgi:DNA-binding MarR family transcriptional regulator
LDRLDLFRFTPFRLNRLAAEVSAALASEYRERYGLDIPEWRVLATLGARDAPCTAQYISHCTRTHKSTISRAVTSLMKRKLIARIAHENDGRAFAIGFTAKGRALYDELVPHLLRKDRDIMSCLTADQRRQFAAALTTIEKSLDLIQTAEGPEPY